MEAENFLCIVGGTAERRGRCEAGGKYIRKNWSFTRQKMFEIFVLENELTNEISKIPGSVVGLFRIDDLGSSCK